MNIIVIVSGGIAAYKSLDLVRKLKKDGHNIKVIMTENATKFVTELSFQTLSSNYVYTDTFVEQNKKEIQHISLNKWADKVIVVPGTANIIAKIASGISDDLATTFILAINDFSKIYICPSMNTNMYENPITQGNIYKLRQLGYNFISPTEGELACGDVGKGKLPDIEDIIDEIFKNNDFIGKSVIVTAGPTKEYIDPVRYISNPSSGKMGISIAEEFAMQGAKVILISSTNYKPVLKNIKHISIVSAYDMFQAVKKYSDNADIIVKSAAVSDYRPVITYDKKVKKQLENLEIELERTEDILKYLGKNKKENQILVGFAAETNNVIEYAKEKIKNKNLDYIVANDVSKKDVGFGTNDNEVFIIDKNYNVMKIEKTSKRRIAKILLEKLKNN